MKHLIKFFEFLGINHQTLKTPIASTRSILQNHYGFNLNISGEFYYNEEVLVIVGDKLFKNWEFYVGLTDISYDCLRRNNFGVYIYKSDNKKVKELLDLILTVE